MLQTQQKEPISPLRSGEEKPLSIAICGIRGIPASYGGFETFAEELSVRLVERGHHVIVYGRDHCISFKGNSYRGVECRLLPAPQHKYFETPVHTFRCFIDLLRRPVDVLLVCNAANSPMVWIPRLRGMPTAVNLDGIERMRGKWNALGRAWYRLGEICSVLFATKMVADADCIQRYYLQTYGRNSELIRYGARAMSPRARKAKITGDDLSFLAEIKGENIFESLGVQPGKYLLYVSRLEPENNAHVVIAAYNRLPESVRRIWPLVIVGGAPYAKSYIEGLHKLAEEGAAADSSDGQTGEAKTGGVVFAGYRYGTQYELLQQGAYVYVQATEVGGTHPALVEAMGFANCVIVNGTVENVEVVQNAGLSYAKNDVAELSDLFSRCLAEPQTVLALRKAAADRADDQFDWDKITSDYERLFYSLAPAAKRRKAL